MVNIVWYDMCIFLIQYVDYFLVVLLTEKGLDFTPNKIQIKINTNNNSKINNEQHKTTYNLQHWMSDLFISGVITLLVSIFPFWKKKCKLKFRVKHWQFSL